MNTESKPKPRGRSKIVAGAILLALLVGIVAFEISRLQKPPTELPQPPLVRVVAVAPAAKFETKSYPGVAKESQIAKLSFRVAGKLVDSEMLVGTKIEKNGVVAKLDPRDYELAVQRLDAELLSAESLFAAMKTGARPEDVASLQSQLAAAESAYTTAETNLHRFTALLADQVASQAQFDTAKTTYDAAKGQKETLRNELEKATTGARKEDIEATAAKITGIKAGLNTAKNALDDTVLKAPFDGMIVEKFIEDHEVVSPGMPIVSFVDVSKIDVAVSLPEEIIVRMDDIRGYRVEFESYPGQIFPATLKELGRAIQRGRQTYPLQVRINLSQENETWKRYSLFPGMAAMVLIDLARPVGPQTLPLAALHGEDGSDSSESAVWVVENDHVVRRAVKLLRVVGTSAEIESDLKPDEKVVAAGAKFLHDGQKIRLE